MTLNTERLPGIGATEGSYAHYDALREEAPVYWSEALQRWVISRHEEARQVYRNGELFSSRTLGSRSIGTGTQSEEAKRISAAFQRKMLFLDNPEHARLRKLVTHLFTPRSVAVLRDNIRETAREMLESAREGETFDFVKDFSGPLPLYVVASMVGVDVGDRDQYREWSDHLALLLHPTTTPEERAVALDQSYQMLVYVEELVAQRRAAPGDDLLSWMISAGDGTTEQMTDDEIVSMCQLLTSAGHETTTQLLTNMFLLVLSDQGLARRAATDAAFRKTAIEETLRWEPPLQFSSRIVTEDTEVAGVSLTAGSAVALNIASVNRDPRVFERPNEFDPFRAENPHLSFGFGAHACLGANLARLEADVVLELLATDYQDLQPYGDIERKASALVRGFVSVGARWTSA